MPKTETDIEKRNKYGMLCGIVGIFKNPDILVSFVVIGSLIERGTEPNAPSCIT